MQLRSVEEALAFASKCLLRNELSTALSVAEKLAEAAPLDARCWELLSQCRQALRHSEPGVRGARRAAVLSPCSEEAQLLSAIQMFQSNPRQAIKKIERLIIAAPLNPKYWRTLSDLLRQVRLKPAFSALHMRASLIVPDDPNSWMALARWHETEGETTLSITAYLRAETIVPHTAEVAYPLALLAPSALSEAIVQSLQQRVALSSGPSAEAEFAAFALYHWHESRGDYDSAVEALQAANRLRKQRLPSEIHLTKAVVERLIAAPAAEAISNPLAQQAH